MVKRETILTLLGSIVFAVLAFLSYDRLYLPRKAKHDLARQKEAELLAQVRTAESRLRGLEDYRAALAAEEPETVESAIREEMSWGRPGEIRLVTPTDDHPPLGR